MMFTTAANTADSHKSAAQRSATGVVWLLLGIWGLAVLARIFLFTGYMNGDMGNYIQEAVSLWDGHYSVQQALSSSRLNDLTPGPNFNWQNLRIGLIALDGLSMKIFGVNNFSYAVLMFGFFSLAFFTTYAIGSRLHSRAFGVTAAALYAFIPKEINLTTILVPHLPADALMALSCYLLVRGLDAKGSGQSGQAVFFLSGMAVGLAYLIHELSILLLPVLVLIFWVRIPLKKILSDKETFLALLIMLAGFGAIFLAEQIYFMATTGVLLLRLKFIAAMGQKWIELNPIDLSTVNYGIYPRAMFFSYDYGIFYLLVVAGLGITAYEYWRAPDRRPVIRKTCLPPLIWFTFIFLYLQFGSTSVTSYKPVFKLPHYLSFIAVPAALLAAPAPFKLLSMDTTRLKNGFRVQALAKLAGLGVVVFFAGSSVLFAWVNYSGNGASRPDITNELKIKSTLDRQGAAKIYTDIWTKHGLDFVYGYCKDIEAYNTSPPQVTPAPIDLSSLKSGFVVVDWIYLKSPYVMAVPIPDIVRRPPRNWHLVARIPGHSQSIDIYRIGAAK